MAERNTITRGGRLVSGYGANRYDMDDYGRDIESANNSSTAYSVFGNVASNIPIIGKVLSPIFNSLSDNSDKQAALLTQEREMEYNSNEAAIDRQFQTSEREAVQKHNLDMWNMENEYNSLSSQLERAEQAGVNPNDVVGNGGSSIAANTVRSTPMQGSSASYSSGLAVAQLQQEAQLRYLNAQTANLESQTKTQDYDRSFNQKTEDDRIQEIKKRIQESQGRFEKLMSDIGVNNVSIDVQKRMATIAENKSVEEINVMKETVNKLRNECLEIIERTKNIKEQTEGQELSNELLKVQKAFSDATGVPLGTSEFDIFYKAWVAGDFDSLVDYYSMILMKDSPEMTKNLASAAFDIIGGRFPKLFKFGQKLFGSGESPASPYANTSPMPPYTVNPTW